MIFEVVLFYFTCFNNVVSFHQTFVCPTVCLYFGSNMNCFHLPLQEYAMQVYLRQVWYDARLRFNKTDLGRSEFSMNWMFADRIWTPDTFFINGKNSYAHAITAPNMFVRLQHDGQLYMSMR